MLTREQAQQLTQRALKYSSFPECTVSIGEEETAFLRFANNGVTTSGFTIERAVSITSTRDGKSGTYQTADLDDAAIKAAVQRSEEMAAIAPPNAERVPPLGPQQYAEYANWDDRTAAARSPEMIPHVKSIIDGALSKKVVAAGYIQRVAAISTFANKAGNFGYQRSTDSRLSTTVRTGNGSSSGWASQNAVRIGELNGADLGAAALDKCMRWANKPARLEPGKYTVVLEPEAVADLLGSLANNLTARAAEEGRSFLSKKGGGTLVGEKLFPENITLRTDPFDRRFPTSLWTQGGLPNRPITWIEKGVVKNLEYERYYAMRAGKEPTPATSQIILEGTDASTADLIKATERGLLVTRFWYIRYVNPKTVQMTGLTRDGLFLIEKGEIAGPAMNFRFNESPVRMLQNAQRLGRLQRSGNMLVPALQAADFTFSSISDAV